MLALTFCVSSIAADDEKVWKLGVIKNNPGEQMMQNKPFPEYFKIIKSEDSSKSDLVVKMRNQNKEKKYPFTLNTSVVTESYQVYGVPFPTFAAKERTVVDYQGDKMIISMNWTRADRPDWQTSSEYKITFREDGGISFLRTNGKNSGATYLEFKAEYELQ